MDRWLDGQPDGIRGFIGTLYAGQLHAKHADSLAETTLDRASLAVAVIGQGARRGARSRHQARHQAIRPLAQQQWHGRLDSFAHWIPHLIGARKQIVVAMDWTDFNRDGLRH